MADLQVIGQVAGYEGAETRLTVVILNDWRDERGYAPPPVYLFHALPGQAFTDAAGGPAVVIGSAEVGQAGPLAQVTYTLLRPGYLPFARTVTRHLFANTDTAGVWDFTQVQQQPGSPGNSPSVPPEVKVLPGVGPKGDPGASLLTGEGTPPEALGQAGDTYLNELTGEVYKKGSVNGWEVVAILKGQDGANGLPGPRGPKGDSFLKPPAEALNFIPVSDGSQPNGYSWRSVSQLGFGAKRLTELEDVDTEGIESGMVLAWDAPTGKFYPVPQGSDGAGGSAASLAPVFDSYRVDDTLGQFLAWPYPRDYSGKVASQLEAHKLYYMHGDTLSDVVYVLEIPPGEGAGYLYVHATFNFKIVNSLEDGTFSVITVNNNLYDNTGGMFSSFDMARGVYYIVPLNGFDRPLNSLLACFTDNRHGGYSVGSESWQSVMLYSDNVSKVYAYQLDPGTVSAFKLHYELLKGGTWEVIASTQEELTLRLVHYTDYTASSGEVLQELTVTPNQPAQVFRFNRVPEQGWYGIEATGNGLLYGFADLNPYTGNAVPYIRNLQSLRVESLAEVQPDSLSVVREPGSPPRLIFRDENGKVFYGPVMTEAP